MIETLVGVSVQVFSVSVCFFFNCGRNHCFFCFLFDPEKKLESWNVSLPVPVTWHIFNQIYHFKYTISRRFRQSDLAALGQTSFILMFLITLTFCLTLLQIHLVYSKIQYVVTDMVNIMMIKKTNKSSSRMWMFQCESDLRLKLMWLRQVAANIDEYYGCKETLWWS